MTNRTQPEETAGTSESYDLENLIPLAKRTPLIKASL